MQGPEGVRELPRRRKMPQPLLCARVVWCERAAYASDCPGWYRHVIDSVPCRQSARKGTNVSGASMKVAAALCASLLATAAEVAEIPVS